MKARLLRSILVLAAVFVVSMASRPARAHIVTLNPGVKLGYTFGPGGGWTYGGEIAVTWMTPEIDWIIGSGAVLDLTWTKGGIFELRAGYEIFGLLYGLEAGPPSSWGRTARTSPSMSRPGSGSSSSTRTTR